MTRESGRERDEVELKKKKSSILPMQPTSGRGPVCSTRGPPGCLQFWKHQWSRNVRYAVPPLPSQCFLLPAGQAPKISLQRHWPPFQHWVYGNRNTPVRNSSTENLVFEAIQGLALLLCHQKEGVGRSGGCQWKVKTNKQAWNWGLGLKATTSSGEILGH